MFDIIGAFPMMDILVCFPQFLCPSGAITPPDSNMELPQKWGFRTSSSYWVWPFWASFPINLTILPLFILRLLGWTMGNWENTEIYWDYPSQNPLLVLTIHLPPIPSPHPRPIMPGEVITGRLVLRIFADLLRTIQVFVEARDLPPRSEWGDARARVAPQWWCLLLCKTPFTISRYHKYS